MKTVLSTLPKATALLLGTVLLAGCGQSVAQSPASPGSDASAKPAGNITNCGRTLNFSAVPQRAVAMTPGQSELFIKLGLAGKVVAEAQTKGGELATELKAGGQVKQLSEGKPPSREALLGVSPDFVYSPTAYEFTAEQGFASIEQLKKAGSEAYIATAGCPERRSSAEVRDILTDIENLGAIFAAGQRASEVRKEAEQTLERVQKAVAGKAQPQVIEVFVEGNTISAIGAGIEYDMIRSAGGSNVFAPSDPAFAKFFAAAISPETLVQKNPDVIVYTALDEAHGKATLAFLKQKFPQVPAVKNNRLVAIGSDEVMPGTWGNIRAVEKIAKALHPESF